MNQEYFNNPTLLKSLRDKLVLKENQTKRNKLDIRTIKEIIDNWNLRDGLLISCILYHNSIED